MDIGSLQEISIMASFIERHKDKIAGVISCYDRIIVHGSIPGICYPEGMTAYFNTHKLRIFDFTQWAQPLREEIRVNAERIAAETGVAIEFIRRIDAFRKEDRIAAAIAKRGTKPGLVHIFSAMETCPTYQPWHDKTTHRTFLRRDTSKCLHYYFYFIDADFGLCHVRVPTWAPFRLQFYCNGHNLLASRLHRSGIGFTQCDNVILDIADYGRAQALADGFKAKQFHRLFDAAAKRYCPVIARFPQGYHWSISQAEYATDIIFKQPAQLAPIYDDLIRTAVHAVKPDHVAMFLGRKLHGAYQGDLGSDFHTRVEGTCIKHAMGHNAVKMYDKFGRAIRIESTTNDVAFFKHYRTVVHRDGPKETKLASMQKTIYSLPVLAECLAACNRRYLDFISAIDDPSGGIHDVDRISRPVTHEDRSFRGFNLFHGPDLDLCRTLLRGEFNISGFRRKDLGAHLHDWSTYAVAHAIKRLRLHGLIKKIGRTYKYYLTAFGKRVAVTALKLKEMFVIPYLRGLMAHA